MPTQQEKQEAFDRNNEQILLQRGKRIASEETTEFLAEVEDTHDRTLHQPRNETVRHAMRANKTAQLVKVSGQVNGRNGTARDTDRAIFSIDHEGQNDAIEGYDHPAEGVITHHTVAWKEGNFYALKRNTEYGICPNCYRSAPNGFNCNTCRGNNRMTNIHFVNHAWAFNDTRPIEDRIGLPGSLRDLQTADPFLTPHAIKPAPNMCVETDNMVFTPSGMCRPNDRECNRTDEYQLVELTKCIRAIINQVPDNDIITYPNNFEGHIMGGTNAPQLQVRIAIDACKDDFRHERTYEIIIMERRTHDFNYQHLPEAQAMRQAMEEAYESDGE